MHFLHVFPMAAISDNLFCASSNDCVVWCFYLGGKIRNSKTQEKIFGFYVPILLAIIHLLCLWPSYLLVDLDCTFSFWNVLLRYNTRLHL